MKVLRMVLTTVVMLTVPAVGWGFEGTLKLRTISIERAQLAKVNGGAAPDPAQALAIMPKQLLDAKDSGAQMRESTVYVTPTKVRMDAPLEKDKPGYAIIDIEKNTTWFVVPSEKRYIEWSEADATAMNEKMVQVEKMMKERMESLPPEQRAQVEQMLKKMKANTTENGAPAKVNIESTGKTQMVNGMQVSGYEVKGDDETMVGWVTQEQPDLATVLRKVQDRMEKMTPPAMRGRQTARTALSEKGFPVMVQTLDPQFYRIEEVVTVDKKPVKADLFTLPKEFTKTTAREALNNIPQQ
jgi:hypothetical protein